MNYAKINVEDEVAGVVSAVENGAFRAATKQETMSVRLAALSEIVKDMQSIVHNDMRLAEA